MRRDSVLNELKFSVTLSDREDTSVWPNASELSWDDLTALLTEHNEGSKIGPCIVPASLHGAKRKNETVKEITLLVFDSDSGQELSEIGANIRKAGYAAIISSTHSHNTTRTTITASDYEQAKKESPSESAKKALINKGYRRNVAENAEIDDINDSHVRITHNQCPKFRIIVPLEYPFLAGDYPDVKAASASWKQKYLAVAAKLGLHVDEACSDLARLFYLPRCPAGGPAPEVLIIDGVCVDLGALVQEPKAILVKTGEPVGFDLQMWDEKCGHRFEIAKALKWRSNWLFTGNIANNNKHHIQCPCVGRHTKPGLDSATFVSNASQSKTGKYVIHCRHQHCMKMTRTAFLMEFLRNGSLTISDLTNPEFLTEALSAKLPFEIARLMITNNFMIDEARTLNYQGCQWLYHNGTCYEYMDNQIVRKRVYEFLEANNISPNRSVVDNVIDAMKALSCIETTISIPSWLPNGPETQPPAHEIISCLNGLLHLPTLKLYPHHPSFLSFASLTYNYSPEAPLPNEFLKFLDSLWSEDPETILAVQEMFGLLLTGDTSHQKIFLMIGPPRSGKGTIGRTLLLLLGKNNVGSPTLASLAERFGLQPLIDKSVAIVSDSRLGSRTDHSVLTERLLSISGQDSITSDRKNITAWTGTLSTRFLILTNEIPKINDVSGALASRFHIIKTTKSFYRCEDKDLTDKLKAELPGILNWAIEGWTRLNERGRLVQPDSSTELMHELEDLSSPIQAFIKDRCIVSSTSQVDVDLIFEVWKSWCSYQGRDHPGTKQTFGRDLRAGVPSLGIVQRRIEGGQRGRVYSGVGVRS